MVDMAHFAGLVAAGLHPSPGAARARHDLHDAQDPGRARAAGSSCPTTPRSPRRSTRRCSPASRAARWSTSSPARPWPSRSPRPKSSGNARSVSWPAPGSSPSGWSRTDVTAQGINVISGGTDVHLVLVDLRNCELERAGSRGPARGNRHHRQPQRRPVRPAPADGHLRAADRHPGAGHPRFRRGGLRRGCGHHRRGSDRRRRRGPLRLCAPGSRPSPPPTRSTRACPTSPVELGGPVGPGLLCMLGREDAR